MKQLCVPTRGKWRKWLAENHDKEPGGIWLVFYRKETGKTSLRYEEALKEALCFGWIDSTIKKLDEVRYCRKFTPRKDTSVWSPANRKRVAELLKVGAMTAFGLAKIEAAKRCGHWEKDTRPAIKLDVPEELSQALARDKKAKAFFDTLAPTYRKQFIGWIVTAKRPETRSERLKESLVLLGRGEKLGLR